MSQDVVLGRFFDPGTIARGRAYAHEGRVVSVVRTSTSRPVGEVLLAEVVGSGGRTYSCLVTLTRTERGAVDTIAGRCTCPMQLDCKHVVATLLSDDEPAAGPGAPRWEEVLGALAPVGPTAPGRGAAPLGVLLQFTPVPTVLRARPVTVGVRGTWVKQGMSWREATYRSAYDLRGHDQAQLALLAEMFALGQRPTPYRYYGDSDTWLDLAGAPNPRVWDVLADAADAGVALLRDDKERSELSVRREPAVLALDLERDDEDLLLTPVLRLGDDRVPVDRVRLLGSPPHAVVHWDRPAHWQVTRLDRSAPDAIAELLHTGPVRVPAQDEHRFLRDYLPGLRRQVRLDPGHGVELPEQVEPAAVLTVTHLPEHVAVLRWRWEGVDPGSDARPPTPTERAVLAELVVESDGMVDVGPFGLRLVEEQVRRGLDLVRFLDDDLPAIAKVDNVRVEVEGSAPDFRQLTGEPVVTMSAEATDDRDWYDLAVTVTVGGEAVVFHDLFVALARGDDALMLPSGGYFSLQHEAFQRLRDLIEEARSLQDRPGSSLRINRYQSSLWEELAALGIVENQATAWRDAMRAAEVPAAARPVPDTVRAQLRPYQREGFAWLCALQDAGLGGVLADDMGLGKTLQTLAMVAAAREADPSGAPYLVVAPASVVGNWVAESARFTPHLRTVAVQETGRRRGQRLAALVGSTDVVVTSYTLFRLEFPEYEDLPWAGLVLDEAQFVKNRGSKTYGCARLLAAPVKLAITGTPLENNLMELWSLLSITAPGLFPSPERFAERYQRPIERSHDQDRLSQLRRRIGPFLLRRTKELVAADLPPKQEQVVELELHPRHRKVYDQHLQRERQKVLGMIDDLDANRFLIFRSLTLLRRLSLSPSLVDDAYARVPSTKLDELVPQLEEIVASGHQVLVFSQFTSFLGQVRERLDAVGIGYAYLDGRTRRRGEVIERFTSGEAPVFLVSLKAGGFGLNLTAADYVFILDPWWNPATEAQAVDRAHRIGQDKRVTVYRLVAKDTIEEKVMALKASKARLFDAVMSDEGATGRSLTADDIRALLA